MSKGPGREVWMLVLLLCSLIYLLWVVVERRQRIVLPASLGLLQNDGKMEARLIDHLVRSRSWRVFPTSNGMEGCITESGREFMSKGKMGFFTAKFVNSRENRSSIQNADHGTHVLARETSFLVNRKNLFSDVYYDSCLELDLTSCLRLKIHDCGQSRERFGTKGVIEYLDKVLTCLATGMDEALLREEGSILSSPYDTNKICICGNDASVLGDRFSAWINLAEPGYVELECMDPATGDVLNGRKVARTYEYVGWDNSLTNKYFYSTQLGVDGLFHEKHVEVSLWFHPMTNESSRIRTFSTNVVVRGYSAR